MKRPGIEGLNGLTLQIPCFRSRYWSADATNSLNGMQKGETIGMRETSRIFRMLDWMSPYRLLLWREVVHSSSYVEEDHAASSKADKDSRSSIVADPSKALLPEGSTGWPFDETPRPQPHHCLSFAPNVARSGIGIVLLELRAVTFQINEAIMSDARGRHQNGA